MFRYIIIALTKSYNITTALLILFIILLSVNASAEWVNIGENNRSVCYANTSIRRSGDTAILWVMYDYKSVQESSRSSRRYLSEKSQQEIDCKLERARVLFFTWHLNQMGDGVVVYTSKKLYDWEPTSSPSSYGNALWNFACNKNNKR